VKLHLVGGWRDGQVIDTDDDRWGWSACELDVGMLPPKLTIDTSPSRMTTYRLVAAEGDEGRYEVDPVVTAEKRALLRPRPPSSRGRL
jgi:hypothetical protein